MAAGSAFAHPGWGIVVDSRGNVFYTDLAQVWKIEPSGKRSVAVAHVHTHALYLDSSDNLFGEHLWYVAEGEQWWRRVWRLSPAGKLADVIPSRRLNQDWWEGLAMDFAFVRDSAGSVYWSAGMGKDQMVVLKRAPNGAVTQLAGGPKGDADGKGAAARFTRLDRMAAGPEGSLYVLDGDKLRRVAPDGTVTTLARGLSEKSGSMFAVQPQHYLMGLWADPSGNVYVANYGGRQVKKVGPDGRVTVFLRSRIPYAPTGGTMWRGSVYVLEYMDAMDRPRVRRVSPEGKITTLP
ncbi:MAG: hypothetical protein M3O85_03190 [Acidobacteriota bacterium]|nr:hypothetical protein [Acidobacteriota bacterium]